MQICLLSFLAAALTAEASVPDGVVPMVLNRVAVKDFHSKPSLDKRAQSGNNGNKPHTNVVLDSISNQRLFYTTDANVGTPAQKLNLLLDTGSSDTWVFGPGTSANAGGFAGAIGSLVGQGGGQSQADTTTFDSSKSSTWHNNNTQWQIQYGMGNAKGHWGTDKFQLGSTTLKHLSIGVADSATQISQGIIGIGRPVNEVTTKQGFQYNNLPAQLKAEGKINTNAYSLYMNDLNAKQGTILFGGVDHSKYTGSLVALPMAHPKHLAIQMHGIYSDGRSTENNVDQPQPAVLDSGTSLSYMPQDVLTNIRTALNANPSFALGEKYYCDCNITENLVLDFGSTRINVPSYNFLWPLSNYINTVEENTLFPQNSCYLGIEPASGNDNFILLGDNFLRSMYLVYDIDNSQIAVAQAATGSGAPPEIQAISRDGIPGAA